jgi:hypothetical protein
MCHLSNPGFYPFFNPLYCTGPSAWLKIASSINSWAAIRSSISVWAYWSGMVVLFEAQAALSSFDIGLLLSQEGCRVSQAGSLEENSISRLGHSFIVPHW